jgi:hypothetical protein
VWADIAIDFVEGFPRVGGKSVVVIVVDMLSKYTHFIPLGHPYITVSVAKAFFNNIVKLHGIPCSIVSDHDPVLTSTFWKELFTLSGIKMRMSTAFHPQTDGQSEVINHVLGVYLHCLVDIILLQNIAADGPTCYPVQGGLWLRPTCLDVL